MKASYAARRTAWPNSVCALPNSEMIRPNSAKDAIDRTKRCRAASAATVAAPDRGKNEARVALGMGVVLKCCRLERTFSGVATSLDEGDMAGVKS